MNRMYSVYMITNKKDGTIYIGVTNNLTRRMYEHKNKMVKGFSSKYQLKTLVYYECTENIESAILREKELKKYKRAWKVNLINANNPSWSDLSSELGL